MGHLRHAVATDIGRKRENNEDNFGVFPEYGIFCVSDGMGGGDDGEVASEATVNAIREFCNAYPLPPEGTYRIEDIVRYLRTSMDTASSWIYERAKIRNLRGCGATFVGVCFDAANPGAAVVLHAGDSRLYRIRGRKIQQITRDHSAAALIGAKSENDINPMFRGMILRAVGIQRSVDLERTPLPVEAGDRILICSDGLSRMVSDKKILSICKENSDISAAVKELVAAANAAGGIDNITAVLVDVGSLPEPVLTVPFPDDAEPSTETVEVDGTSEGTDAAENSSQPDTATPQTGSEAEDAKSASTEETFPQGDSECVQPVSVRKRTWLGYVGSVFAGILAVALIVAGIEFFSHKESLPTVTVTVPPKIPPKKPPQQKPQENPSETEKAKAAGVFLASCSNRIEAVLPLENRQERLRGILSDIDGALVSNVVSEAYAELLRASVRQRQTWVAGKISNECSSDVLIPFQGEDKWIATNSAAVLVFTNGLPKKWTAARIKYEDRELPRDFDGREVVLRDGDFKLKSVLVKIPLEDSQHRVGISCWIDGKRMGDEKHVLGRPGEVLVGDYRRKGYESQGFRYKVTFDEGQRLPSPATNWTLRPVSVSLPDLPEGVTCWIGQQKVSTALTKRPEECVVCVFRRDGYAPLTNSYTVVLEPRQKLPVPSTKDWKPLPMHVAIPSLPNDVRLLVDGKPMKAESLLMPGYHECRYERPDYRPQLKSFELKIGGEARLPPPDAWHETADLKKLEEIELAISNGTWSATNELRSVKVKSKANEVRLVKLKTRIREHEIAERKRIAAAGRQQVKTVKKNDAEAVKRQLAARMEKDFEEAFKKLMDACKPDMTKEVFKKASMIQILEIDNDDFQKKIDVCRNAKTPDGRGASLKEVLQVLRGLAKELLDYWAMEEEAKEEELRKDNPERKLNDGDERKRMDAVRKAEAFVNVYEDSDRQKMSAAMKAAADFITSFLHAPFR